MTSSFNDIYIKNKDKGLFFIRFNLRREQISLTHKAFESRLIDRKFPAAALQDRYTAETRCINANKGDTCI